MLGEDSRPGRDVTETIRGSEVSADDPPQRMYANDATPAISTLNISSASSLRRSARLGCRAGGTAAERFRALPHVGNEAVATPGDGRDVLGLVVSIQDLAQQEDLLSEVAFLDEGSRPHGLQELVFGDDPRPLLDQEQQQVEGLGRQRLRNALAEQ